MFKKRFMMTVRIILLPTFILIAFINLVGFINTALYFIADIDVKKWIC